MSVKFAVGDRVTDNVRAGTVIELYPLDKYPCMWVRLDADSAKGPGRNRTVRQASWRKL
jgi:hypothetical protein